MRNGDTWFWFALGIVIAAMIVGVAALAGC